MPGPPPAGTSAACVQLADALKLVLPMCDHWDLWGVQVDRKAGAYQWLTYRQVAELVDKVASGLVSTGLQAKDKVAVYGSNSPEWMIAMQVGPSSPVSEPVQQSVDCQYSALVSVLRLEASALCIHKTIRISLFCMKAPESGSLIRCLLIAWQGVLCL